MREVASEGLLGEIGAEGRLGRVCEVSCNRNGVSKDGSDRSSAMGQRKKMGAQEEIIKMAEKWEMCGAEEICQEKRNEWTDRTRERRGNRR